MLSTQDVDVAASRRFTRWFLAVFLSGAVVSATIAVVVDPLRTFGTGRIPSILTGDRDDKPALFLRTTPSPQAIVLGSSKVMKYKPACVTELTGLRAFNFGLSDSLVEDWDAAFHFARAHANAPIREVIIGVDPEAFDNHAEVDPRLPASTLLRPFVRGSKGPSWAVAMRSLFGWQALRYGLASLRYHLQPSKRPRENHVFGEDGYLTYEVWEPELERGTLARETMIADWKRRLEGPLARRGFTELSPRRVELFVSLVKEAHESGARVDVVIPPIIPILATALEQGTVGGRLRDLDQLLTRLERDGLVHYLRARRVEDIGGDPREYFDGIHMTETNTNRLLLAMFGRAHGCGQ